MSDYRKELSARLLKGYLEIRDRVLISITKYETDKAKNLNHTVYSDISILGVSLPHQKLRFENNSLMDYLFSDMLDVGVVSKKSVNWLVSKYEQYGLTAEEANKLALEDVYYFSTMIASWIQYRTINRNNSVERGLNSLGTDIINYWHSVHDTISKPRKLYSSDETEEILMSVGRNTSSDIKSNGGANE